MNLLAKLGLTTPDAIPEKLDEARHAEREYRQSLGFLVEDAHARVDALVASARDAFDDRFVAAGRIPDSWRSEFGWQVATVFVLASDEFAKAAHAAVDRAAKAGRYDPTPRAEVEAKLAEFEATRRKLALAAQEEDVSRAEAEAKAARDAFDAKAAEVMAE